METNADSNNIRDIVKQRYGKIASAGGPENCGCTPLENTDCCIPSMDIKTLAQELGYSGQEIADIPELSNLGLGCGNPNAIARLKEGDKVLDLGCGAGIDVFLAAKQVGDKGSVIGVDMTAQMIEKAKYNALEGGYSNVEFRLGEIENLPVDDNSIDVIISNCVINLSPEKKKVINESYRVLKSGGRLAISDIVSKIKFPEHIKNNIALYTACVAGASTIEEWKEYLEESGFKDIRITPKNNLRQVIDRWVPGTRISDYIVSASIEGVKP